jgi:hypothetical protein
MYFIYHFEGDTKVHFFVTTLLHKFVSRLIAALWQVNHACHRGGIDHLYDLSKVNVSLVFKVRDSKSLMIDKTYSIRLEFRNINESKK